MWFHYTGAVATTVYLSLGSNLGDRESHLREAVAGIAKLGRVSKVSSIYETEPREFTDQPWFLNCCVEMAAEGPPAELLRGLLAIERSRGRRRSDGPAKGPRTVDADILLFGREVISTPALTLPHPGMHERRFVLEPLCEIAPDAFHPVFMRSARDLLAALPAASGEVCRFSPAGVWPPWSG